MPVAGLQVRWNPVKDATAFILVIEHEKTHREIRANLPATATTFTVPEGFLSPGLEYKVAIGPWRRRKQVVHRNGIHDSRKKVVLKETP